MFGGPNSFVLCFRATDESERSTRHDRHVSAAIAKFERRNEVLHGPPVTIFVIQQLPRLAILHGDIQFLGRGVLKRRFPLQCRKVSLYLPPSVIPHISPTHSTTGQNSKARTPATLATLSTTSRTPTSPVTCCTRLEVLLSRSPR